MTYEQVQDLQPEAFKRLCGIRPETFAAMVRVLEAKARQKRKLGRPSKLNIPNQLLMTLQYWREYRTYFHLAQSWGVDKSTAHRTIRAVELALIQLGQVALPGKKTLYAADSEIKVLVVDVTETPVERPKKTATLMGRQLIRPDDNYIVHL